MIGRDHLHRSSALLALCVLASLACGPLARGPTATPTPAPSPTALPVVEPTPSPTLMGSAVPTPSLPEESDILDMDLAPCPPPGSSMLLKFSANIGIEYGEAEIEHMLQDGTVG